MTAPTEDVGSPVVVFNLQGQLDASRAAALRMELSGAVGHPRVLLDLTEVDFIDSVGLGVLLGAIRRFHEGGGRVAIAAADPRRGIARSLRSLGVDRLVLLTATGADGLRGLGGTE